MNLEDLRVFSAVASERSFSRAATRVGRTQPAVSQAVRRLEEAVGEQLIDRAQRDGTLTQAGVLLLDYAARLLRLADEAHAAVTEMRDVERGRIQIGANEAAVHVLLPMVIGAFTNPTRRLRLKRAFSTQSCIRPVSLGRRL